MHDQDAERLFLIENAFALILHDINGPMGIGITGSSFLEVLLKDLKAKAEAGMLSKSEMERSIEEGLETSIMIRETLTRASIVLEQARLRVEGLTNLPAARQLVEKAWEETAIPLLGLRPEITAELKILEPETPAIPQGSLQAILAILLDNSFRHAFRPGSGGKVSLSTRKEGGDFLLTFADDGKGMKEEELAQAFKAELANLNLPGGRMGLPLLHRILTRKLRGKLEIESREGLGTLVTIRIPLA